MIEFFKEIWLYMKVRKKYWLAPVLIFVVFIGAFLVLAQSSPIAPFIYTLF
ncbi:MAG: hypothetical protein CME70_09035 [Halobacteriovorax sp.]|nr:hypothetical protein [Halobacteriovorax sp.]